MTARTFDLQDRNSFTMFNAIDAEKMEMAFQVIVDGNLDNADMDYTGNYAAATCYNSEKATDLAGMMRNERDWVVVFNIPRIEAAIKAGKFINVDGVQGAGGGRRKSRTARTANSPAISRCRKIPTAATPRRTASTSSPTASCRRPAPSSPSTSSTTCSAGKISDPRGVVVGEPELGLGPLHTTYDGRGFAYTTLFIDSQVVKWNIAEAVRAYEWREGRLHQAET